MRGSTVHNVTLLAPIDNAARTMGAAVYREHHVCTRSVDGFVDRLIVYRSTRIVIEAERTLDRMRWDIIKAMALKADQLYIVFPTGRLARAAEQWVAEAKAAWNLVSLEIFCLTVGAAVQRLQDTNPFKVHLYVPQTTIQQNMLPISDNKTPTRRERSVESCKFAGTTSSR